jgi:hypothetical protein
VEEKKIDIVEPTDSPADATVDSGESPPVKKARKPRAKKVVETTDSAESTATVRKRRTKKATDEPVASETTAVEITDGDKGDEIIPHDPPIESFPVKDIDFTKKLEEDSPPNPDGEDLEVKIDLSKVIFDDKGIPVLNREDIYKIKASGFYATDNFQDEIQVAKENIRRIDDDLDEKLQQNIEDITKEDLKENEEKLKDENLSVELKDKYTKQIEIDKDILDSLPKNNEKIKEALLEERQKSIELIAAYQLISRKDIDDLVKDKSIITLISQTSVSTFYDEYKETFIRFNDIQDSQLLTDLKQEYDNLRKESCKYDEAKAILEEVISNDNYKEMDDTNKGIVHQLYYQHAYGRKKDDLFDYDKEKVFISEKVEHYDKLLRGLRMKLNEEEKKLYGDIKAKLRTQGLMVSMLEYALMSENTRIDYCKAKNYLEPKYHDTMVDKFFYLTHALTRNSLEEEFSMNKNNINSCTMFLGNLLTYIGYLYNDTTPDKWKSDFDEKGQIAIVYKDNKEEIDSLYKQYMEQKVEFIKMMEGDIIFKSDTDSLAYTLFNEDMALKKAEEANKKIKNRIRTHLKSGFNYQFMIGAKDYIITKEGEEKPNKHDSFFNTMIHNTLGYSMVYSIMQIHDILRFNLKSSLYKFCTEHLFYEYIMSQWAVKAADADETAFDMIKNKTKTLVFKSGDLLFIDKMDVNKARYLTIKYVLQYALNVMRSIMTEYHEKGLKLIKEIEEKENKLKKQKEKEDKVKSKKEREKEIELNRKKKKKEARLNKEKLYQEKGLNLYLDEFFANIQTHDTVDPWDSRDGIYIRHIRLKEKDIDKMMMRLKIIDADDTKITLNLQYFEKFHKNDISKLNAAILEIDPKSQPSEVFKNSYYRAFNTLQHNFILLNTKIYYKDLIEEYSAASTEFSEEIRGILHNLFYNYSNEINDLVINYLKRSNNKYFELSKDNDISIAYKSNSRVKTYYFDATRDNGINPAVAKLYNKKIINLRFELPIDIIIKEKQITIAPPVEVIKEDIQKPVINRRPMNNNRTNKYLERKYEGNYYPPDQKREKIRPKDIEKAKKKVNETLKSNKMKFK